MEQIKKLSLYIFFGLLAYMPLHIFLSTWLGTSFGLLEFAKIFKDVVLVLGFGFILAVSLKQSWFKGFISDRLTLLILAYALLTVLLSAFRPTDQESELLAVVYNLRYLVFFLYAGLLCGHYKPKWLLRRALQTVLGVAVIVMTFGAFQYLLLPDNALTHVGYSRANGVLPAFFIDEKPDLERVMSTVRDPNSYGAYLLIILAILAAGWLWKTKADKTLLQGMILLALLNIYFTFSRSAWIGAIITALALLFFYAKHKKDLKVSRKVWVPALLAILLLLGTMYLARDTYLVKNVILHADENTVLEDPNQLRIRFWRESLEASSENPIGYGPGTAGIVSIRNKEQGTVLTENYYLQILYEVGVVGLVLFAVILAMVGIRLYRLNTWQAAALLAAFLGIAASNILNHIWTVEAVAYTWWGLAGLALVSKAGNPRRPRVSK